MLRPYNQLLQWGPAQAGESGQMSSRPKLGKDVHRVDQNPRPDTAGLFELGLLVNPFTPPSDGSSDTLGVRLAVNAAALRLLIALDGSVTSDDRKPIVVEKSPEIPAYYNIAATARVFKCIAQGEPIPGILQAYVPIDMMRIGRVRAPLGIVAERVAGPGVDLTIAAWARLALTEPDSTLAEFAALEGVDLGSLVKRLDSDPAAFTAWVFGDPDARRAGAEDAEVMMRVATSRTARLDPDPAEDEESTVGDATASEEALDDPMADAFVTPLETSEAPQLGSGESADDSAQRALKQDVADYLIAYTSAHLSPVLARGIRAFAAQGTDAMAQELKVSKAPSKTLAALLRFAETRIRLGAILFDNFDIWPSVPADLRLKISTTFSQLRWTLKDVGILVFFLTPGSAPEVEEAFASGHRVSWDFAELFRVADEDSAFDAEAAATWLRSASLDGTMPSWGDELIAAVPSGMSLVAACGSLSGAIDLAAEAGTTPDATAINWDMEGITA